MTVKRFGDRWDVIKPIGEGGQGWVYEVRDTSQEDSQTYVLKRLKNIRRLDRFVREVEAGKRLSHEGIARIIDYSLKDEPFFVAVRAEGEPVGSTSPMTSICALDVFSKICGALDYAHENGVVHRDLKPDNVILSQSGQPTIVDFGLCYFLNDDERLTETMEQVGSRFYMAPEFEAGRTAAVTAAADIYSLGKMLYFMLTGRHMARENFSGDDDLVTTTGDEQLGYITERILSRSIVVDPERRASPSELRVAAIQVRRLLFEHYYPGTEGSVCRFCGEGHYRKSGDVRLRSDLASGGVAFHSFTLLRCDRCNNAQWF